MPHLYVRGRYWWIAGDELCVPLSISVVGRTLWLMLLVIILYLDFEALLPCLHGQILVIYLISSNVVVLTMIICDIVTLMISLRGSIIESDQRIYLDEALSIRSCVLFIQILCFTLGVVGLSLQNDIPCNANLERSNVNRIIFGVILLSQCIDVVSMACCCYLLQTTTPMKYLNPEQQQAALYSYQQEDLEQQGGFPYSAFEETYNTLGVGRNHSQQSPGRPSHLPDDESQLAKWEEKFHQFQKRFGLNILRRGNVTGGGNDDESLHSITRILTKMFHHQGFLDVVPSDIAAGIILIRIEQRCEREKVRQDLVASSHITVFDAAGMKQQHQQRQQHEEEDKSEPLSIQVSRSVSSAGYGSCDDADTKSFEAVSYISSSSSDSHDTSLDNYPTPIERYRTDPSLPRSTRSNSESQCSLNYSESKAGGTSLLSRSISRSISRSREEFQEETKVAPEAMSQGSRNNSFIMQSGEKMLKHAESLIADDNDITQQKAQDTPKSKTSSSTKQIALLPHGTLRRVLTNPVDSETALMNKTTLRMLSRSIIYAAAIYTHIFPVESAGTKICRDCLPKDGVQLFCCCWLGTKITQSKYPDTQISEKGGIVQPTNTSSPAYPTSSSSKRYDDDDIEGINFCGCNRAGLSVLFENIPHSELIYLSYRTHDMIHKPYAIFLDHEQETVVITIRGTLSIEDCITDVLCEAKELAEAGRQWGFNGNQKWAHGGMLQAALAIRQELEDSHILHKIFGHYTSTHDVRGRSSTRETNSLHTVLLSEHASHFAHYNLVVTGHSMGAGTAVLLAMLLRSAYPNVRSYGFGTPAVLDKDTSKGVKGYVTTVVLGNDIVSRLTFRSICTLRNQLLEAIARAKVNKMYIMTGLWRELDALTLMHPKGQEPNSSFKEAYTKFKQEMDRRLNDPNHIDLFLPGKILHLVKSRLELKCCGEDSIYEITHGHMEDYQEIAVSSTMVSDHSPDLYYHELLQAMKQSLKED